MAKYSYTWAVEEFNGTAWRVKEMDTEISDISDPFVYAEAKRAELAQAYPDGWVNSGEDWPVAETGVRRLNISDWGVYTPPKRNSAAV